MIFSHHGYHYPTMFLSQPCLILHSLYLQVFLFSAFLKASSITFLHLFHNCFLLLRQCTLFLCLKFSDHFCYVLYFIPYFSVLLSPQISIYYHSQLPLDFDSSLPFIFLLLQSNSTIPLICWLIID